MVLSSRTGRDASRLVGGGVNCGLRVLRMLTAIGACGDPFRVLERPYSEVIEGLAWLRGLEVLQWLVSSPNIGLRTSGGDTWGYWNGMMVWQVSQIGEKQKRYQALRFGREWYVPSMTER